MTTATATQQGVQVMLQGLKDNYERLDFEELDENNALEEAFSLWTTTKNLDL